MFSGGDGCCRDLQHTPLNLFDPIQLFLQRLKDYNWIPPTTEMMELEHCADSDDQQEGWYLRHSRVANLASRAGISSFLANNSLPIWTKYSGWGDATFSNLAFSSSRM